MFHTGAVILYELNNNDIGYTAFHYQHLIISTTEFISFRNDIIQCPKIYLLVVLPTPSRALLAGDCASGCEKREKIKE